MSSRTRNEWGVLFRRALSSPRGGVGFGIVALVVAIALIGPVIAPFDPLKVVTFPFAAASGEFLLGADYLGRDVLSRTLAGGQSLLGIAALATVLAVVAGGILGILAAYLGGIVDTIVMRTGDVLLSIPQLVMALLLISVLGPQWWLIVIAIVIAYAPQVARVIRGAALDVCERDFVRAAESIGTPALSVITKELLPNLLTPLMVEFGLRFTYAIIFISGLSFLGLGQPPPAPDWGLMINENRLGLPVNIWSVLVPAALIACLTVGVNLFTDAFARAAARIDPVRVETTTQHIAISNGGA